MVVVARDGEDRKPELPDRMAGEGDGGAGNARRVEHIAGDQNEGCLMFRAMRPIRPRTSIRSCCTRALGGVGDPAKGFPSCQSAVWMKRTGITGSSAGNPYQNSNSWEGILAGRREARGSGLGEGVW